MNCFVYIMASERNGTLYLGVTSDLAKRVWQHKNHELPGFTKRYSVSRLVWFEGTPSIEAAIAREKQLKNWKREWKIALVEKVNPYWRDLYDDVLGGGEKSLDCGSSPQ
ncbi:MAG TPA: GIY-YIG nuclease family protein [Ramlibacter sp.]|nr:GIY-YIG nuclease family protein [Ramlibacter sp.]